MAANLWSMDARRTLPALVLALATVLAACSSSIADPQSAAPSGPTVSSPAPSGQAEPPPIAGAALKRTSDGGEATVVVEWVGPGAQAVFDVVIDSHSVDLDDLDLSDAILRNDQGAMLRAQPWTAPRGGHHRKGQLRFEADTTPFFAGATWIELVLSGVGQLPVRTLRWDLGS
jgi:hypothetical protein